MTITGATSGTDHDERLRRFEIAGATLIELLNAVQRFKAQGSQDEPVEGLDAVERDVLRRLDRLRTAYAIAVH